MRLLCATASLVVGFGLLHCGKDSSGSASVGPSPDGGTTSDGGTGADGGTSSDGGTPDGGTASSDCDGLAPGTPGTPAQISLPDQDLNSGECFAGETDGTGHIAVSWQNGFQPHDSRYKFIDPSNARVVGSYLAAGMYPLIGQASGFMGGECNGSMCCCACLDAHRAQHADRADLRETKRAVSLLRDEPAPPVVVPAGP